MKIQCKLIREGGTVAEIGGKEYHFKPLADGAHVADIENDDHVDRFLAIPEGYCLYRGKDGVPANDNKPKTEDSDLEAEADLDALRAEYLEKFGRNPHPSAKAETIKAKLAEGAE